MKPGRDRSGLRSHSSPIRTLWPIWTGLSSLVPSPITVAPICPLAQFRGVRRSFDMHRAGVRHLPGHCRPIGTVPETIRTEQTTVRRAPRRHTARRSPAFLCAPAPMAAGGGRTLFKGGSEPIVAQARRAEGAMRTSAELRESVLADGCAGGRALPLPVQAAPACRS